MIYLLRIMFIKCYAAGLRSSFLKSISHLPENYKTVNVLKNGLPLKSNIINVE